VGMQAQFRKLLGTEIA